MYLVVYRMGRLCGGAHEISGIKAPIILRGWVGGGGVVVVVWVVGWMGVGMVGWVLVWWGGEWWKGGGWCD